MAQPVDAKYVIEELKLKPVSCMEMTRIYSNFKIAIDDKYITMCESKRGRHLKIPNDFSHIYKMDDVLYLVRHVGAKIQMSMYRLGYLKFEDDILTRNSLFEVKRPTIISPKTNDVPKYGDSQIELFQGTNYYILRYVLKYKQVKKALVPVEYRVMKLNNSFALKFEFTQMTDKGNEVPKLDTRSRDFWTFKSGKRTWRISSNGELSRSLPIKLNVRNIDVVDCMICAYKTERPYVMRCGHGFFCATCIKKLSKCPVCICETGYLRIYI